MKCNRSSILNLALRLSSKPNLTSNLLQDTFSKAKLANSKFGNVFLDFCQESAEKQSHDLDSNPDLARDNILRGVPIAIKDNFNVLDSMTTAGSRMLQNFQSPYDSTVSSRLKLNGAIPCLKCNMDEFGMGSSMMNSAFGLCSNPWGRSTNITPGGSSGASAVAVATGVVPVSIGSDTGGSVRQPASFCGIVGFKPTYGSISRYGLISYASSLDTPGVMARYVADAAIVFSALHGHDDKDPTSIKASHNIENILSSIYKEISSGVSSSQDRIENIIKMVDNTPVSLQGVKIGVPEEFLVQEFCPSSLQKLEDTLNMLECAGATISTVSIPLLKAALPCYYVLACAEASSNLSRYDGIRYGHRTSQIDSSSQDTTAHAASLHEMISMSRAEGFGQEVIRRILTGCFVLSESAYNEYYGVANDIRMALRHQFASVMEQEGLTALIGLTSPNLPFAFSCPPTSEMMLINDLLTVPANLLGAPAISLPIGKSDSVVDGRQECLPLGLQFLAQPQKDVDLLRLASITENLVKFDSSSVLI